MWETYIGTVKIDFINQIAEHVSNMRSWTAIILYTTIGDKSDEGPSMLHFSNSSNNSTQINFSFFISICWRTCLPSFLSRLKNIFFFIFRLFRLFVCPFNTIIYSQIILSAPIAMNAKTCSLLLPLLVHMERTWSAPDDVPFKHSSGIVWCTLILLSCVYSSNPKDKEFNKV